VSGKIQKQYRTQSYSNPRICSSQHTHEGRQQTTDGADERPTPDDSKTERDSHVPRNRSDRMRHILFLQLVTPHQNGVRVGSRVPFTHVVGVVGEARETNGADLVERFDLVASRLVVFDVAVGLPLSTAVLDFHVGESGGRRCGVGRGAPTAVRRHKAGGATAQETPRKHDVVAVDEKRKWTLGEHGVCGRPRPIVSRQASSTAQHSPSTAVSERQARRTSDDG
jgi:hypothetical protein